MIKFTKHCLALVSLSAVLAACSPFGTDNTPAPSPLPNYQPSLALSTQWTDDVGGIGDDYFNYTLSANGDTLYTVNKKGLLVATNTKDHHRLWRVFADKTISSGPAYAQNSVIFTTSDGNVYAVDSKTGTERWHTQLSNQVLAQPTVSDGAVFVKTIDDQVIALDANTGKQRWDYSSDAPELVLRGGSSPVKIGGIVVVGLASGKLIALNSGNGKLLWQQTVAVAKGVSDVERMVDITITPVVNGRVVYVATYQGKLAAYNLDSGKRLWQRNISAYTGITVNAKHLFITDAKGDIWAFNRDNGSVIWRQPALEYRGLTAPVLMGKTLVVGDKEGYLHWLNQADGKFIARKQITDSAILSTPLVQNQQIYALATNGRLAAIAMGH